MDETLKTDKHHEVNVWDHEGKVHLSVEDRRQDRVQVVLTPMQARMVAQMLQDACPDEWEEGANDVFSGDPE
jgi:hypothetical protein